MARVSRGAWLPLQRRPESEALGISAQIYRACVDAIVEGRLAPGARLPSARQLAADWDVARNTVDDALGRLQGEGFLERRVGAGTFVAAVVPGRVGRIARSRMRRPAATGRRALATLSAWGRATSDAYAPKSAPRPEAFIAGLPALDLFPLDLWRRLVARRMRVSGRALLGYFPTMGHGPLQKATARYLATARGMACSPDQIMIVNSTMQAVDLVTRVLLEPGDSAWVEDPCYPNLRAVLAMAGVKCIPVPVDGDGIDVAHGARHAADAALAFVSPSCQYPTGATMSVERRLALVQWADRAGAWIVEDDYQCEFTYEGRPIAPIATLDRRERVLYIGTFTNSVFPSLRLAYLVLPRALVPVFRAVRAQQDDHTHGLAQAVMADFADGGHFGAHLRKMRAVYGARRDALVAACARELDASARLGPTTTGMNAALYLPRELVDRDVAARARASGIAALALSRHSASARGVNGLLLGYTALSERRIAEGIALLARVLEGLRIGPVATASHIARSAG
jgi:GntR family transcriptional regulator / MocR family aminotransferase